MVTSPFADLRSRLDHSAEAREWDREQLRRSGVDVERIVYGGTDWIAAFYADAMVAHASKVTRLLWPTDVRGGPSVRDQASQRGAALRRALDTGEDAFLRPALRDSIEHFDERLDQALRENLRVVGRGVTEHDWPEVASDYLARHLNTVTLVYRVGSDEVDLQPLGDRMHALLQATITWNEARSARARPDR